MMLPICAIFSQEVDMTNCSVKVIVKNCPNCKVTDITNHGCVLWQCDIHDRQDGERYEDFFFVTQTPKARWDVVLP